ncbi:MAG: molecular chaperone HtpG [Deltaproteobacteria bacterium]|nr:molecular chaperone HtpG [Deltaproteobacteria bacterium]
MTTEKHEFQAEVQKLLDLMVHSIYSNKDVFLRELISNASDALDKLRFLELTNPELRTEKSEHEIRIERNEAARTLTISDDGIGMTRDEVVQNIGTIARSGTKAFIEAAKAAKDHPSPELIGQFGVGFYSAFMVADEITLLTRKAGEPTATLWKSVGQGEYTIEPSERTGHGTTITLRLKPVDDENGLHDYADERVIRGIVKKYSDFVTYPIKMPVWKEEKAPVGKDEEAPTGTKVLEEVTLNSRKAIWTRSKDEVTGAEYDEFYKHIAHDWHPPLLNVRVKIEGTFEASALLFVPSEAPFDLYHREMRRGIQLYVKRVFVMDECKELVPEWLRFMRGVVDAEDLSLNVSREILQKDRQIQAIRKQLTKRTLDTLSELLTSDREKYSKFFRHFGAVLKEGLLGADLKDHDKILDLLLLESSRAPAGTTATLAEYVGRMKEGQKSIYFLTGPSREVIEASPHLEAFKAEGFEILYLPHAIDEMWPARIAEYKEKPFVSVAEGRAELGGAASGSAVERAERETKLHDLLSCLRVQLQDDVSEVRLSDRLTSSLACLVSEAGDLSPRLAKMLEQMGQEAPKSKRALELNPTHPLLEKLDAIFAKDQKDPRLTTYAKLIYAQALLAEGGQLQDPAAFGKLLADVMVRSIDGTG